MCTAATHFIVPVRHCTSIAALVELNILIYMYKKLISLGASSDFSVLVFYQNVQTPQDTK